MLRLHWSPDSANLPVRIALEMFGLEYDAVRVDRAAGEHRLDDFRTLNPQGLIPVLEDGELVLFETGAILWHLAEKMGRLGPHGPKLSDDRARIAALKWIFFLSNTVHADLRIAFGPGRYVTEEIAVEQLAAGVSRRMRVHFDLLEAHVYQRTLGHPIILPDLYFSALARWAQLYPVGSPVIPNLDRWPSLQAMCQRVETEPGAIRAFTAEYISADRPVTSPSLPDLPVAEVTGV